MKSLVPFAVVLAVGFILNGSLTHAVCPKPKFIDLTFSFNNETVFWGSRNITFSTEVEQTMPGGFWMAARSFCTSEHTSTHIDAPYHYNQNGRRLHEIPFEDLIDVPGVMIDIFDKVHKFKDGKLVVIQNYVLTRQDILEWEAKNGKIPQGAVVMLYTGWGMRWGDNNEYMGIPEGAKVDLNEFPPSYLNFPGYDISAAKFLAEERQVRGAGIDTLAIDPGNTKVSWHIIQYQLK
ncbi:unnamed protein product [Orchesella dallaii]|uniref:Kynurenine formamidase n=1 Tax=Orchesella dallaii TaxID=48710 RepID=A0ABP1QL18_9HEXA